MSLSHGNAICFIKGLNGEGKICFKVYGEAKARFLYPNQIYQQAELLRCFDVHDQAYLQKIAVVEAKNEMI